MAGGSGDQNDIVWPGYVAAMASLLLSLLLVCAVLVMTIGQIGSIIESYQQAIAKLGMDGKDIERLAQLAGISEDKPDAPADAEEKKADDESPSETKEAPEFTKNQFAEESKGGEPLGRTDSPQGIKLDLEKGLFNLDAARQAARLASADRRLLAQIDLSNVDVRKIKFKGLDFASVQFNRNLTPAEMAKVDFKAVDFGNLSQARIDKLKPLLAKEAIRFEIKRINAATPAIVAKAPVPALVLKPEPAPPEPKQPAKQAPADHFRIVFTDESVALAAAQKTILNQWFDQLKQQDAPVRIWTEIPQGDDSIQRSAYTRLVLLRGWAIDAGLAPASVQVNLEQVPGSFPGALTFHMAPVRR